MENNKMVSFNVIMNDYFKRYDVYIPLIQRNYKWDVTTASRLATDLWSAYKRKRLNYTLGMITLYKVEDTYQIQLIDGQQRMITLLMLLKYIQPKMEHFTFRFERDEGLDKKRQTYLSNITSENKWTKNDMYMDVARFEDNYCAIKKGLEDVGYTDKCGEGFFNYIIKNVHVLLHITGNEPFDEFVNLNKNKTRFVISDRIKAHLIIDSKKDEKATVLHLFQDLSKLLFNKRDVWELVQQGYIEENIPESDQKRYKNKHYPDENRLKLLCCERYGSDEFDGNSILEYDYNVELTHLKQYKKIFLALSNDLEMENWNSYNAYNCLFELNKKLRFFSMLNNNLDYKLEEVLLKECEDLGKPFQKACFIESQLQEGKKSIKYIEEHKNIENEFDKVNGNQKFWIHNGAAEFEMFKSIYLNYIKGKYKSDIEVM